MASRTDLQENFHAMTLCCRVFAVVNRLSFNPSTTQLSNEVQKEFVEAVEPPLTSLRFVQDKFIVGIDLHEPEKNLFGPIQRFTRETAVRYHLIKQINTGYCSQNCTCLC